MVFDQRRIAFIIAAFSFLSIGIMQLYASQVLIGRPPFAATGEWYGPFLAWTVGVSLIISGLLAVVRPSVSIITVITAVFVICYCVLPNLWLVVNGDTGIALTCFGKGISLATGLLVLTAAAPSQHGTRRSKVIMQVCVYSLGFFLMASGIQHFLFAPFVKTLIPPPIPFPGFWTYAAGGLLALSGLCLITGFKRRVALYWSALMIFSWVLIVHVPRAFFTARSINESTALFEALAFASLLFVLSRAGFIEEKLSARNFFRREVAGSKNNN
jgi:uncharacterized membrane protein YphA (DoxX/SURF4 family)